MRFVDTNILFYALDLEPSQPGKTAIAQEILTSTDIGSSCRCSRSSTFRPPTPAAKAARCRQLLSEDLSHGQDYDGVTVVNPFLSEASVM